MVLKGQIKVFRIPCCIGTKNLSRFFQNLVGTVFTNDVGDINLKLFPAFIDHMNPYQVGIFIFVQLGMANRTIEFVLSTFTEPKVRMGVFCIVSKFCIQENKTLFIIR